MILSVVSPVLTPPTGTPTPATPLDSDLAEYHIYELCSTFAGAELHCANEQDSLLPAYATLFTAAFLCATPAARSWLWHKLAHGEDVCPAAVRPVRRILGTLWKVPELVGGGFGRWKMEPLVGTAGGELVAEDIELASRVEELSLGE